MPGVCPISKINPETQLLCSLDKNVPYLIRECAEMSLTEIIQINHRKRSMVCIPKDYFGPFEPIDDLYLAADQKVLHRQIIRRAGDLPTVEGVGDFECYDIVTALEKVVLVNNVAIITTPAIG